METDKNEYLRGEPVVLRITVDGTLLSSEELKEARTRSGEKLVVEKAGGGSFAPLPTMTPSLHRARPTSGAMIEQFYFLQPVQFWFHASREERQCWGDEFLSPGAYTARLEQDIGVYPNIKTLASNRVNFTIVAPGGRDLEAWNVLTSHPEVLCPVADPDFPPDVLGDEAVLKDAISFAGQYLETPYGQFAAVQSALYAFLHDKYALLAEAYATIGQLVEIQPECDFVRQYTCFLYLVLENLLEEGFDPARGLATMREFETSLSSPPLLLRQQVQRLIHGYEHMIAAGERPQRDRIDRLVGPLEDRGELPTDPEVRSRRHEIALGRAPQ